MMKSFAYVLVFHEEAHVQEQEAKIPWVGEANHKVKA